jgi:ribosome-associated protein
MAVTKKTKKKPEGIELARLCAKYAEEKKAMDVVILDVTGLSPITDFMVICSATSSPHLRAVRDEILDEIKVKHEVPAVVSDGNLDSQWMVIGYSDVNVHVFSGEKREFYAIEQLWNDAPRLPLKKPVVSRKKVVANAEV